MLVVTLLFFSFVAAAALTERLPLAVNYVMVTVTMVARASWILKLMYLCVCEYLLMWVIHIRQSSMWVDHYPNVFLSLGQYFFKVGVSCTSLFNCPSLTHVLHYPCLISFLKIS